MNELIQQLQYLTARVESIKHFGSMMTDLDLISSELSDTIEDGDFIDGLFDGKLDVEELWGTEYPYKYFFDWLAANNKLGFAVQIATPVREYSKNSSSFTYLWGSYSTKWVYGDTFEQALQNGIQWVASEIEKAKQKDK